jgi:1-acyl-sn-glycerol-3-phosphate acyltransferase
VRRNLLGLPTDPPTGEALDVAPAAGADDPVGQAVAAAAHLDRAPEGRTLSELGIDSLAMVELVAALEARTGRRLRDEALRADMTVAELRAALAAAPDAGDEDEADGEDEDERPLWPYTWGRAFRPLAAPIDLLYRWRVPRTIVLGREQLAGLPDRVILAGNHHSFADTALVRAALGASPARRLVGRLAVATLGEAIGWRSPASAYGILALGLCPLQQQRGRGASLRHLARVAEAGNAVLIFPQGQHSRAADEQADPPRVRFKTGAAHLARALDAPVVPFGLAGTEAAMPPTLAEHRGLVVAGIPVRVEPVPLAIAFGAPLRQRAEETAWDFTHRLEQACYALAAEAQAALDRPAGAPGARPPAGEPALVGPAAGQEPGADRSCAVATTGASGERDER